MAHLDSEQGNAWKLALETQQFRVTYTKADIEIASLLDNMLQNQVPLPDLILIDIAIKSKPVDRFSESPQAETICRWIWKNQASTKVVILNAQADKISELEHRWATRRGATDVLPKLYQENLTASIKKIANILACNFLDVPLQSIFSLLLPLKSIQAGIEETLAPIPLETNQSDRGTGMLDLPSQANSLEPISELDRDETVIIYRGSKITTSQMPRAIKPSQQTIQDIPSQQSTPVEDDGDTIIYRGVKMKRNKSL
jgi:CheY-like chemotaxis protein